MNKSLYSPFRLFLYLNGAVFIAEFSIMLFLHYFTSQSQIFSRLHFLTEAFIDSFALVIVNYIVVYRFFFMPLRSEMSSRKKAEEMLFSSEEKYRTLTESAADAIVCINSSGIINLWNKKAEEMFGYTAEEAMGKDLHALIAPERYREKAYEGLRRFSATGAGYIVGKTFEYTAIHKNGTEFPVALSVSAIKMRGEWHATGIMRDISERVDMEKTIKKQAEMLDLANDAILIRDFDDKITYLNHAAELQYGWSVKEALGKYPHELLKTVFPVPFDEITASLLCEGSWQGELMQTCRDGSQILVFSSCRLLIDENGKLAGVLEINYDITEKKKAEEKIKNLSLTDELTGIYNRRGFYALVQQQLKIAGRMNYGIFFFFADIDDLKRINDGYGHHIGDMAIVDAANIIKETFRQSDIIARIGGDEFVVAGISNSDSDKETFYVRVKKNIQRHNAKNIRPYDVSMSAGIVRYEHEYPESIEDLLMQADKLMYEEKRRKKEKA